MFQTSSSRLSPVVIYADIFHYPLTEAEIHRYLIGVKASRPAVHAALLADRFLSHCGPYYFYPGQEALMETRQRRSAVAEHLWPEAIRYGRILARLPYVRMVALTGSLAMKNAEPGSDLDYLLVTQPGRLWLARMLAIGVVRLASLRGDLVCPNYLLSERALALPDRDIFIAHELAQMVPISGMGVYQALRRANRWVDEYLPNAAGPPYPEALHDPGRKPRFQSLGERILNNPAGDRLESWEMHRKLLKFDPLARDHPEACFGPESCKGHIDDHGQQVLLAYSGRLSAFEGSR
jgi:hypothetical protein